MRRAGATALAVAAVLTLAAAAPDGVATAVKHEVTTSAAAAPAPAPGGAKTIAQRIDDALEHEFGAKDETDVGKTYSEKAKSDDVRRERQREARVGRAPGRGGGARADPPPARPPPRLQATVETVVKVSSTKARDDARRPARPPPPPPPPPPAAPAAAAAAARAWWPVPRAAERDAAAAREAAVAAAVAQRVADAGAAAKSAAAAGARGGGSVDAEVDRIIDSQDNEYVLSSPKDASAGLTLDPQLVRDLTAVLAAATVGGASLEAAGQPQISGYFLAGSAVGPGGLKLVKEIVQVESLAQLGVQLLLFGLGLDSSAGKLRAVRGVALGGGALQIAAFTALGGGAARLVGGSVALVRGGGGEGGRDGRRARATLPPRSRLHQGLFIGALVSMSSTSVVVKCLADTRGGGGAHGAVAVGTLILQDCAVGLLFALTPALAHAASGGSVTRGGVLRVAGRMAASLAGAAAVAALAARAALPRAAAALGRTASAELYQLAILSYCLLAGWASAAAGLSTELGAFVAGAALARTDQRERAAAALEPAKSLFLALFIASTGLVMSPPFLLAHARVLAGAFLLVVAAKAAIIALIVRAFGLPARTALGVGLTLAQISEFAFVLLSAGSRLGLLTFKLYQLLMGTTALSLLATPFLVRAAGVAAGEGGGASPGATTPGGGGKWGAAARRQASGTDLESPPSPRGRGRSAGPAAGEARRLLQRHTANGDG